MSQHDTGGGQTGSGTGAGRDVPAAFISGFSAEILE